MWCVLAVSQPSMLPELMPGHRTRLDPLIFAQHPEDRHRRLDQSLDRLQCRTDRPLVVAQPFLHDLLVGRPVFHFDVDQHQAQSQRAHDGNVRDVMYVLACCPTGLRRRAVQLCER